MVNHSGAASEARTIQLRKRLYTMCVLLSGICVEAMCSPTSVQPLQTIMLCLKSIYTLLDDPWPRSRLGVDSALSIELLNVLHR